MIRECTEGSQIDELCMNDAGQGVSLVKFEPRASGSGSGSGSGGGAGQALMVGGGGKIKTVVCVGSMMSCRMDRAARDDDDKGVRTVDCMLWKMWDVRPSSGTAAASGFKEDFSG